MKAAIIKKYYKSLLKTQLFKRGIPVSGAGKEPW
jgi:hypothetical protein